MFYRLSAASALISTNLSGTAALTATHFLGVCVVTSMIEPSDACTGGGTGNTPPVDVSVGRGLGLFLV